MKAYYGKNATAENDFGYNWVPKITGNHSLFEYLYDMADGKMEGMFIMGQNPAVAAANSRLQRKALARLKWLVVRDLVEIEAATFWSDSPEIERGELKTEEIETEVFFFPAAGHAENDGTFTNTQRLLQWREKAVDPPGDCAIRRMVYASARAAVDSESESNQPIPWTNRCVRSIGGIPKTRRRAAHGSGAGRDQRLAHAMPADRSQDGVVFGLDHEGNPHHGPQVDGYSELKADGSTACGCWIYSGVSVRDGVNRANTRQSKDYLGHGWGFAWPSDRRIIYNRASARPTGEPWSERKKLIWWDRPGQMDRSRCS